MSTESSYHIPARPRNRSRRWIFLLIALLIVILASYWIPMYQHFPDLPFDSLAQFLISISAISKEFGWEHTWSFILSEVPIVIPLLALIACISITILLGVLALRVRHSSVRLILLLITTLIVCLSGWVIVDLGQVFLFRSGLDVSIRTVPGVYLGLAASVAAWLVTLVIAYYSWKDAPRPAIRA